MERKGKTRRKEQTVRKEEVGEGGEGEEAADVSREATRVPVAERLIDSSREDNREQTSFRHRRARRANTH